MKAALSYIGSWLIVMIIMILQNGFVNPIMSFEEMVAAAYFSAIALALHCGLKWAWENWL